MKSGLEEFLKRIEAKPTNETLIDRFMTLVLEEEGVERILYLKSLVGLLLKSNPYAALKAAYVELQEARKEKLSNEYEIGALKDVESCFINLGKTENAALVREEIAKLSSDSTRIQQPPKPGVPGRKPAGGPSEFPLPLKDDLAARGKPPSGIAHTAINEATRAAPPPQQRTTLNDMSRTESPGVARLPEKKIIPDFPGRESKPAPKTVDAGSFSMSDRDQGSNLNEAPSSMLEGPSHFPPPFSDQDPSIPDLPAPKPQAKAAARPKKATPEPEKVPIFSVNEPSVSDGATDDGDDLILDYTKRAKPGSQHSAQSGKGSGDFKLQDEGLPESAYYMASSEIDENFENQPFFQPDDEDEELPPAERTMLISLENIHDSAEQMDLASHSSENVQGVKYPINSGPNFVVLPDDDDEPQAPLQSEAGHTTIDFTDEQAEITSNEPAASQNPMPFELEESNLLPAVDFSISGESGAVQTAIRQPEKEVPFESSFELVDPTVFIPDHQLKKQAAEVAAAAPVMIFNPDVQNVSTAVSSSPMAAAAVKPAGFQAAPEPTRIATLSLGPETDFTGAESAMPLFEDPQVHSMESDPSLQYIISKPVQDPEPIVEVSEPVVEKIVEPVKTVSSGVIRTVSPDITQPGVPLMSPVFDPGMSFAHEATVARGFTSYPEMTNAFEKIIISDGTKKGPATVKEVPTAPIVSVSPEPVPLPVAEPVRTPSPAPPPNFIALSLDSANGNPASEKMVVGTIADLKAQKSEIKEPELEPQSAPATEFIRESFTDVTFGSEERTLASKIRPGDPDFKVMPSAASSGIIHEISDEVEDDLEIDRKARYEHKADAWLDPEPDLEPEAESLVVAAINEIAAVEVKPDPLKAIWLTMQERLKLLTGLQIGRSHAVDFVKRLLSAKTETPQVKKVLNLLLQFAAADLEKNNCEKISFWLFEELDPFAMHQLWESLNLRDEGLDLYIGYIETLVESHQHRQALSIMRDILKFELDMMWYKASYPYLVSVWEKLGLEGWIWREEEGGQVFCDRLARREDPFLVTLLG